MSSKSRKTALSSTSFGRATNTIIQLRQSPEIKIGPLAFHGKSKGNTQTFNGSKILCSNFIRVSLYHPFRPFLNLKIESPVRVKSCSISSWMPTDVLSYEIPSIFKYFPIYLRFSYHMAISAISKVLRRALRQSQNQSSCQTFSIWKAKSIWFMDQVSNFSRLEFSSTLINRHSI